MTGRGAMSASSSLQNRMLELPVNTVPPGGGAWIPSRASKASIAGSHTAGSSSISRATSPRTCTTAAPPTPATSSPTVPSARMSTFRLLLMVKPPIGSGQGRPWG
jgi:hypothetical protein